MWRRGGELLDHPVKSRQSFVHSRLTPTAWVASSAEAVTRSASRRRTLGAEPSVIHNRRVAEQDQKTPIERRIERSYEDTVGVGKPLSRRARQTRRSVEAYLKGGVLPRHMERLREIEAETDEQRRRLEHVYRALQDKHGDDPGAFSRLWRQRVQSWRFDKLNELIRQHNEWYPIESSLPMDPRTRDYQRIRGRSYRREEIGPDWVLRHFPADPA
jgi:hypothetical protein